MNPRNISVSKTELPCLVCFFITFFPIGRQGAWFCLEWRCRLAHNGNTNVLKCPESIKCLHQMISKSIKIYFEHLPSSSKIHKVSQSDDFKVYKLYRCTPQHLDDQRPHLQLHYSYEILPFHSALLQIQDHLEGGSEAGPIKRECVEGLHLSGAMLPQSWKPLSPTNNSCKPNVHQSSKRKHIQNLKKQIEEEKEIKS